MHKLIVCSMLLLLMAGICVPLNASDISDRDTDTQNPAPPAPPCISEEQARGTGIENDRLDATIKAWQKLYIDLQATYLAAILNNPGCDITMEFDRVVAQEEFDLAGNSVWIVSVFWKVKIDCCAPAPPGGDPVPEPEPDPDGPPPPAGP